MGYGRCVHIVYGHRAISSTGPRGQPGVNPYRDCAGIVRKLCNVRQLLSILRSLRTEIVRSPCRDRPTHGARAGIVQCHLQHVYALRSYDFSKFVKLLAKPNRRGCGARESVRKSHGRLLPPQGGLAEAARKGRYGQDTGSVDPSQAKCELGVRDYKKFQYALRNSAIKGLVTLRIMEGCDTLSQVNTNEGTSNVQYSCNH